MKQGGIKKYQFSIRCVFVQLLAATIFSQAAHASFVSFEFIFDGASYGNTAQMTGTITFDEALLTSTGIYNYYSIGGPEVLDIDVDVTGASSGNGHFVTSDFSFIYFSANGGVLDPNSQLVGQSTNGLPWGTSDNLGVAGVFNLFGLNNAPYGTWWFEERAAGGGGDLMRLTSMTPIMVPSTPIESWTDSTQDLIVGTNGFFGPSLNLKANQSLSERNLIIEANGRVTQTGGTHFVSGAMKSNGKYALSGGLLSASSETIGDSDVDQGNFGYGPSGTFNQNGGTNIVNGALTLGKQVGTQGTYNLTAGTLVAQQQVIGDAGTGTFNQSGGTNTVSGSVVLGQQAGSHGVYNLMGGLLTAVNEIVGDAGEGTFTQGNYGYGASNSTNSVNGTLTLGKQANGTGTYNLVSGTLTAQQQIIGDAGAGTFNQSGGTNAVTGALVLGQQAGSRGVYNLIDGVLTALHEVIGDAGEGTFTQGQHDYGYGATSPTNSVSGTLTLGKEASGTGTYNLLSGALTAQQQIIGDAGTGTFNQSGGTNTMTGALILGKQAGSLGMYNLIDGVLVALNEVVGDAGEGTFTQGSSSYGYGSTSPTNTVSGTLTVGKQAGSVGTYNLISGSLISQHQIIGDAGAGVFNQTGGRNQVSGTLTLGKQVGGHGQYNLQGGELISNEVVVGDAGVGIFTQSGGVHSLNNLVLGKQNTGVGQYVLKGGDVNVHGNIQGGAGSSSVLISGGALHFDAGNHEVAVTTFEISESGVVDLANNAIATFQGKVKHNGQEIHIGTGGNAIFNGEFEGSGVITGLGTITFNSVFKPGDGPITFTVEGDMVLGDASTTVMEIAGNSGQYDSVSVGGKLYLDGQLQVSSLGGFAPHLGDTFDLFSADQIFGQFDLLTLFVLGDGMTWEVDYLTDAIGTTDVVRASVVSSVPLPASIWLIQVPLLGLAAIGRARRRIH